MIDVSTLRVIDFEGYQTGSPILVGEKRAKSTVSQLVLEPKFSALAEREGLYYEPLPEYVERLAMEGDLIGGYSSREARVLTDYPGLQLRPYLNVLDAIRRFIRRQPNLYRDLRVHAAPSRKRESRFSVRFLSRFLDLPGLPSNYGTVTTRLNTICRGIRAGEGFQGFTPSQKRATTNLLRHNAWDVVAPFQFIDWMARMNEAECERALVEATRTVAEWTAAERRRVRTNLLFRHPLMA